MSTLNVTNLKVNTIEETTSGGATYFYAKSWLTYNLDGTQTINDSEGISSITDAAVEKTTVSLSFSYSNTNYCIMGTNAHPTNTTYRGITSGNCNGCDDLEKHKRVCSVALGWLLVGCSSRM